MLSKCLPQPSSDTLPGGCTGPKRNTASGDPSSSLPRINCRPCLLGRASEMTHLFAYLVTNRYKDQHRRLLLQEVLLIASAALPGQQYPVLICSTYSTLVYIFPVTCPTLKSHEGKSVSHSSLPPTPSPLGRSSWNHTSCCRRLPLWQGRGQEQPLEKSHGLPSHPAPQSQAIPGTSLLSHC